MRQRVAVLMGGMSAEREVSLASGNAVMKALCELGYDCVPVDVGPDLPLVLHQQRPDVAFIALHGRGGEDGSVQGLLEVMRIPYTGCGVFASAATMDKVITKKLLRYHGIPVAADIIVTTDMGISRIVEKLRREIPYPVMVKPAREGSSIGVVRADSDEELKEAVASVFLRDEKALIEEYLDGRLLTVGILGSEPTVLPVLEIKVSRGFYDYCAKYQPGISKYEVPAEIPEEVATRAMELALESFKALECEGVGRIDLLFDEKAERLAVLEINAVPGMTETSLLPKAASAAGLEFQDVVRIILESARLKIELEV